MKIAETPFGETTSDSLEMGYLAAYKQTWITKLMCNDVDSKSSLQMAVHLLWRDNLFSGGSGSTIHCYELNKTHFLWWHFNIKMIMHNQHFMKLMAFANQQQMNRLFLTRTFLLRCQTEDLIYLMSSGKTVWRISIYWSCSSTSGQFVSLRRQNWHFENVFPFSDLEEGSVSRICFWSYEGSISSDRWQFE